VYQTSTINRNEPFALMFVVLVETAALVGKTNANPLNFKLQNFGTNNASLVSIEAKQGGVLLSDYFPNTLGEGSQTWTTDYFRLAYLLKTFNGVGSVFTMTEDMFRHGYCINAWSCLTVQSYGNSPQGRLTAGPVDWTVKYNKNLDTNVTAIFISVTKKVLKVRRNTSNSGMFKIFE